MRSLPLILSREFRSLSMFAFGLLLLGCQSSPSEPVDLLHFQGQIASKEDGPTSLLVITESPRPDSLVVTLAPAGEVQWRDGSSADESDLDVDRRIEVWTSGIAIDTKPRRVAAIRIVLDP